MLRQVCGRCHEESLVATEETCRRGLGRSKAMFVAFARALCASGETKGAVPLQKRTLREVRADLGPVQLRRAQLGSWSMVLERH